jgi:hypothetical protein
MSNPKRLDKPRDLITEELKVVSGGAGCVIDPPLRNADLQVVETVLTAFTNAGGRLPPFD